MSTDAANEETLPPVQTADKAERRVEPIQPSGNVSFFTQHDMVHLFHRVFRRYEGKVSKPIPPAELALRIKLINEEVNKELIPALEKLGNADTLELKAKVLDGLCDSIYVLLGTSVALGLPFDVAFNMVHDANMAKLGPDAEPIVRDDGKIMKPPGWKPARLHELLLQLYKIEVSRDAHQLPTGGRSPAQIVGEDSAKKH